MIRKQLSLLTHKLTVKLKQIMWLSHMHCPLFLLRTFLVEAFLIFAVCPCYRVYINNRPQRQVRDSIQNLGA